MTKAKKPAETPPEPTPEDRTKTLIDACADLVVAEGPAIAKAAGGKWVGIQDRTLFRAGLANVIKTAIGRGVSSSKRLPRPPGIHNPPPQTSPPAQPRDVVDRTYR